MKNIIPLLALPAPSSPWQQCDPPKDRGVWVEANLITRDGAFTEVEPYEGFARWDESAQDWHDLCRRSIRGDMLTEIRVFRWMELERRAEEGLVSEQSLSAHIYHWDDELRRETGRAGFFALVNVSHGPTGVRLEELFEGPFATRAEAARRLQGLIAQAIAASAPREVAA